MFARQLSRIIILALTGKISKYISKENYRIGEYYRRINLESRNIQGK